VIFEADLAVAEAPSLGISNEI